MMSDKMDLAKIIEKVVNRLMQEMAYKISDLCESYSSELGITPTARRARGLGRR